MDTQVTTAVEHLRTQLAVLDTQKQQTEVKLADQHATIRRVALKRGGLVESLTGANDADSRRAHKELDECDLAIRVGERMAESLQKALVKTVQEIQGLHAELAEVERVIRAEERARVLEAFQINLKQAARRAGGTLDSARSDLAALNDCVTKALLAANGDAAHELNIHRIVEPVFADFIDQQANLDRRGWRLVHTERPLQFYIRPMTRG